MYFVYQYLVLRATDDVIYKRNKWSCDIQYCFGHQYVGNLNWARWFFIFKEQFITKFLPFVSSFFPWNILLRKILPIISFTFFPSVYLTKIIFVDRFKQYVMVKKDGKIICSTQCLNPPANTYAMPAFPALLL